MTSEIKNYHHIFFDLDHTIWDFDKNAEETLHELYAIHKLDEYIKNTHEYYKLKRGQLEFETIDFNNVLKDMASLFRIAGKMENIRFISNVVQNEVFLSD